MQNTQYRFVTDCRKEKVIEILLQKEWLAGLQSRDYWQTTKRNTLTQLLKNYETFNNRMSDNAKFKRSRCITRNSMASYSISFWWSFQRSFIYEDYKNRGHFQFNWKCNWKRRECLWCRFENGYRTLGWLRLFWKRRRRRLLKYHCSPCVNIGCQNQRRSVDFACCKWNS